MPRIEDLGGQVGAPGAVDYAPARPNQAFANLERQAAGAEAVLEQAADHDAALEGASALAEFRAARAKRQIELRTQATDPATFTESALADFDEQAEKLVSAHDNERVQMFLEQRLVDARAGEEIDSAGWAAETIVKRRAQKTIDTVGKFANIVQSSPGQFKSALDDVDAMIDAAGLPLDMADRQRSAARAQLARSAVYGQIETNPGGVLKQLQGGQWDAYLDPDNKIAAVNAAQGEIKRRESEARANAAAAQADALAGLAVRINQFGNGQGDDVSQADLDSVKGKVKPSAWASVQMAYDDARARRDKDGAERVNVAEIIQAGGHVDPGNEKQVKAYDRFFKADVLPRLAAAANGDSAKFNASVVQFVGQQGVVPETLKSSIRTNLRSGTPDQRIAATQLLDQLKSLNPQIINDFSEDEIRFGSLLSASVDRGMNPTEAARSADEVMRTPKASRQALDQAYGDLTKVKGLDGTTRQERWLKEQFAGWWRWSSSINVLPSVAAEADEVVRNEFLRNGGDLDAARISAKDILSARFGVSEVNGAPQVMRNPPEQHYEFPGRAPAEVAKAIRDEAIADISAGGLKDPNNPFNPDTVRLQPYPIIGRTSPGGKPVYALQVKDAAGRWHTQIETNPKSVDYGNPKPWYPSLEKLRTEQAATVKAKISEARGEVPAGAVVEGTQVFSAPARTFEDTLQGRPAATATPRRLIGYLKDGKFVRQGPEN
jgi:hypothetical protein